MIRIFLLLMVLFAIGCNSDLQTLSAETQGSAAKEIDGAQLYKINCAQCHKPSSDFTGPALAGVEKRWLNKELLYEFVRNSQEVIKKDAYAAALFIKWKQAPMQAFPNLTNEEIDAVLHYCNSNAQ